MLIHGFGVSLGHWRKNIPVLAENGYRVFALDLLGFGGSDKAPIDYTLELWEEQLRDFWSDRIGEPVVLAGNSIGALLSLMLMADYPEMAPGGILLNCAGGLNHRPEELHFPLRQIMGVFTKLVSSPLTGSFLFNQIRQKHRIRKTLRQVYGNPEAITDELIEMIYEPSCHPGAREVFASILTAPPGPRLSELLPRVRQPLLVIWGEDDPWTPISGSRIFQESSQTSAIEFVSLPQTGHCPHDDRPEAVNKLILDWLEKQQ